MSAVSVTVICLEGCHGSGKTVLTRTFADMGYPILDEGFMEMPSTSLHPQSLSMETTWSCMWIERLLNLIKFSKARVIIADRSPLSAVLYAQRGRHLLEPLIREQLRELTDILDVHIRTVHIHTSRDVLWGRISARLEKEPGRVALAEGSMEWMDTMRELYDGLQWDFTVKNDDVSVSALADSVLALAAPAPVNLSVTSSCQPKGCPPVQQVQ
jgi:thymidylate kinase